MIESEQLLNREKTVCILFPTFNDKKSQKYNVKIDGVKISIANNTKVSGNYIDAILRWDDQIRGLFKRVTIKFYVIKKLGNILTFNQILQVYYMLIKAKFT